MTFDRYINGIQPFALLGWIVDQQLMLAFTWADYHAADHIDNVYGLPSLTLFSYLKNLYRKTTYSNQLEPNTTKVGLASVRNFN